MRRNSVRCLAVACGLVALLSSFGLQAQTRQDAGKKATVKPRAKAPQKAQTEESPWRIDRFQKPLVDPRTGVRVRSEAIYVGDCDSEPDKTLIVVVDFTQDPGDRVEKGTEPGPRSSQPGLSLESGKVATSLVSRFRLVSRDGKIDIPCKGYIAQLGLGAGERRLHFKKPKSTAALYLVDSDGYFAPFRIKTPAKKGSLDSTK